MSARGKIIALDCHREPNADDLVQVPPGIYDVMYVEHFLTRAFDGGKLGVNFKIITMGEHFEKVLTAWYRVKLTKGGFKVGPHSKFARDWRLIFRRGANRWDRVPMRALSGLVIRVKARTVTHDYEQRPLDPVNQYSVIDELIGRLDL